MGFLMNYIVDTYLFKQEGICHQKAFYIVIAFITWYLFYLKLGLTVYFFGWDQDKKVLL